MKARDVLTLLAAVAIAYLIWVVMTAVLRLILFLALVAVVYYLLKRRG